MFSRGVLIVFCSVGAVKRAVLAFDFRNEQQPVVRLTIAPNLHLLRLGLVQVDAVGRACSLLRPVRRSGLLGRNGLNESATGFCIGRFVAGVAT